MGVTVASSPLTNDLCRRLGAVYPIFGFAHSVAVTAAITNAGGVGVFGATRETPEEIAASLREIRSRVGGKPFGVDLVLPKGMPERDDRDAVEAQIPEAHRTFVADLARRYEVPEPTGPGMRSRFVRSEEMAQGQIRAVLESDVDLFACGIGAPPAAVAEAKALGKTTCALIGSRRHAEAALRAGVDLIVAQGSEAGAHTGQIGTFTLVPQVVEACGAIPVLAAGGVATGRHMAAAAALGAQGVWMGTAWLLTEEHALAQSKIDKLLRAQSDDAVICRGDSGKPLRQVRTAWSDAWNAPGAPPALKMPYQDILVGDLLGAIEEFDVEPLQHHPAGQSIGYFNRLTTVGEIVAQLVAEAEALLAGGIGF